MKPITQTELKKILAYDPETGIHGVNWSRSHNTWTVDTAGHYVGRSKDFFEACCIRKSSELNQGFHDNHGVSL